MTFRGHVKNGQILLDEPRRLPEGASVNVEVVDEGVRITWPRSRGKLPTFDPILLPGGSLADELVKDRR